MTAFPIKTVTVQELIEDRDLQLDLIASVIRIDAVTEDETVSVSGLVATIGTSSTTLTVNFDGVPTPLSVDLEELSESEGDSATVSFVNYEGRK